MIAQQSIRRSRGFAASASDVAENERREARPATLGGVLNAKAGARIPEKEWVSLVERIAEGDEVALNALYARTHRIVFTLAMRLTANRQTAEELTVDVFHDVWRRAPLYDPANGTVLGWIMNQARSRALDRLRFETRKKRVNAGDREPEQPHADPDDVLEMQDQSRLLCSALTVLTRAERQAIEATFFAGLTHAEAAARLDQPLGTIKTRIRSGLHKLRRALTVEAVEP